MKTRLLEAGSILVAAAASIAFGLSFGFTYGVNNQVQYMLGAMRLVDRGLFADDWLTSHTLNYHPAFAMVGWFLLEVGGRGGWGIGIGTTVAASVGAMSVYWLARRLFSHAVALPAFLATVAGMFATGTREVAATYAFDPIFQPSTIASACLLASLAPFVAERWLLAGIILAVGGLMHANYLVLGLAAFGIAHLALGRRDFVHRVVRHLGPSLAVLLSLTPLIFKATRGGVDVARAHEILFDIRSPHHYHLRAFVDDFFPFLAWQTLGLGLAGWVFSRGDGRGRRFGALVLGLLCVTWGMTGLSLVFGVDRATELFGWRLAAHVDILMQLVVAATIARLLVAPEESLRMSRAGIWAALGGAVGLAVAYTARSAPTVEWLVRMAAAAAIGVAFRLVVWRFPEAMARARRLVQTYGSVLASAMAVLLLATLSRGALASIEARSNLIRGMPGPETDLYAWIRANTAKDAAFLSPPGLERFRLASERPIVVDWKGVPYAAPDLIEWYRRLEDVSGRNGFRTRDQVIAGYEVLDRARLDALRAKYHVSYAVVSRGREAALGAHAVYSNAGYSVIDLR